jgi:hypothetical protein
VTPGTASSHCWIDVSDEVKGLQAGAARKMALQGGKENRVMRSPIVDGGYPRSSPGMPGRGCAGGRFTSTIMCARQN